MGCSHSQTAVSSRPQNHGDRFDTIQNKFLAQDGGDGTPKQSIQQDATPTRGRTSSRSGRPALSLAVPQAHASATMTPTGLPPRSTGNIMSPAHSPPSASFPPSPKHVLVPLAHSSKTVTPLSATAASAPRRVGGPRGQRRAPQRAIPTISAITPLSSNRSALAISPLATGPSHQPFQLDSRPAPLLTIPQHVDSGALGFALADPPTLSLPTTTPREMHALRRNASLPVSADNAHPSVAVPFVRSFSLGDSNNDAGPLSLPISVTNLASAAKDTTELFYQFGRIARLPRHGDVSPSFRMSSQNRHSMYPFSHSVVRLRCERYVNASHVVFPDWKQRHYVAAMGPLTRTVDAFWSCVWQLRTPCILMLTALAERGRSKCEKYWPDVDSGSQHLEESGLTITPFPSLEAGYRSVSGTDEDVQHGIQQDRLCAKLGFKDTGEEGQAVVARCFVVSKTAEDGDAPFGTPLVLLQLQTNIWPDFGVMTSKSILDIRRVANFCMSATSAPVATPSTVGESAVKCEMSPSGEDASSPPASFEFEPEVPPIVVPLTPPLLVHCSAGVGRTGAYIAIDKLASQIEQGAADGSLPHLVVDVAKTVCHMRQCRMEMCYTERQYAFVHTVLAEVAAQHLS